eukprot:jgi/Undpi1/14191/HiC_scaffold_9.g03840.m1
MSNAFYDSDDGDDAVCPLCCEPMDLSDQNFLPCPCGYKVCMWCWHRIKKTYTNLCPACRSEYSDDPHAFAAVNKDEVIKNENNKKKRAKQKETDAASAAAAATAAREHQHALHLRHHHQHQQHMQHLHREQVQQQGGGRGGGGGGGGGAGTVANRRELANMRVVQRNLVYATGLPSALDSEEVLRRPENFGQYGKIYKIAISSSQGSEPRQGNVSAHVTFAKKEDALACILATDGYWLEGRQLRSNFGTTKYCATYLRNSPCSNPDCLYLHELGEEEDRFTKEEIQQRSLLAPPIPPGAATVTGGGGPSGTGMRCNSPYLPPPVYESTANGAGAGGGGGATLRSQQAQQQAQAQQAQQAQLAQQQAQQAAAAGAAAASAQRGAGRGSKPSGQIAAAASASKTSTSVGVAWGGAGATNGPSAQPLGDRSATGGVLGRGKGGLGAASPTASPHLQAHDPKVQAPKAGSTVPADASASMFSNPFFSNGGRAGSVGVGVRGSADAPSVSASTAPAPPGFSELPSASLPTSTLPPASSSSSPSTNASASPPQAVPQQPARSLFEGHFGGGGGGSDSVFNGGMFSSPAIGGGLFSPGGGGGVGAGVEAVGAGAGAGAAAPVAGATGGVGSPPPGMVDAKQGLLQPEQSSSARINEEQESPLRQSPPDMVTNASVVGLVDRPQNGSGKGSPNGASELSFAPLSDDKSGSPSGGFELDGGVSSSVPPPVVASPFGAASGGGHFGGAFGSALFPISTHQRSGSRGVGGLAADADGPGADLSVDPFANSSGALAAMLGVTLPPVDSHSSLASKMRTGVGEPQLLSSVHDASPQQRSHLPPRGGPAYGDFTRDMGRGREAHVQRRVGARDGGSGERIDGHRNDYGMSQQGGGGGGGGGLQENQASRFSFAQDESPGLPFSPARGSPPMGPGPDPRVSRGSPGGMGSPPHHGQHRHHLHHHHQSHAHRPFGPSRPLSPPLLGGEYGGKVLPGVSLSYGERQAPAGGGAGGGQGQGQPAVQGASGVPAGGGVGWGDNAAGQRVDPAQAFGSSLWTMAPAPNAPRQPQGSRGGGYGAW